MQEQFKQDWVLAILADRLFYAMKEECEIFFSFFTDNLQGPFHHIYDEKTALEFFKKVNIHPSGGDTQVGLVIEKIRKEVENGKPGFFNLKNVDLSKDRPEILVINDRRPSCVIEM